MLALPHRRGPGGRVRPALRRHAHVGADRRACRTTADADATASDVEGPLYVEDPPWREAPVKIYEDYEGMRRRRGAVRPRRGDLDRRHAAARRGDRHLADRPERRLRHLGRAPARVQLPRPLPPRGVGRATSSRRWCRSRTPCRPRGPSGRYLEAVGQHPWRPAHIHFKVDRATATGPWSRRCSSPTTRTWTTTRSAR